MSFITYYLFSEGYVYTYIDIILKSEFNPKVHQYGILVLYL